MQAIFPVWTTKDGRRILIAKMDDNHLKNTIAMLARGARRFQFFRVIEQLGRAVHVLQGECAREAACAEIAASGDMPPLQYLKKYHPLYAMLCREADRRKGV